MLGTILQYDSEVLTKSRINKNASTSLLLKAPLEVRDNILRLVLGDRMIHIRYMTSEDLKRLSWPKSISKDENPLKAGFYSTLCVAEKSEQEAYDEANRSSGVGQAEKDPDYIEPCKDRHKDCLISAFPYKKIPAEKLQGRLTYDKDLTVLAVCRLLYEESNNILWETNTFAFDDHRSFKSFNASMNASQKHKLKRVHIRMDVAIDDNWYNCNVYGPWSGAVVPRILTPLHNLNLLHLSFDQHCMMDGYLQNVPELQYSHAESQRGMKHDMDALLGLRLLPWKNMANPNHGKHVTVIVSDDETTQLQSLGSRWTKGQKLEIAEEFRASLATPNSGEIHELEVAANQEAKRLKNDKSRRAMVRYLETLITNIKLKVNGAKEKAEDLQAEAEKRVAKRDDAMGKGSKKMDSLIKSALYHTNRAEKAKAQHRKLSEKLAGREAELAKSMADQSYTPPFNKHVPWDDLDEYMSD